MSTPLLSTYVKGRVVEREQQMQTAFPAKVLSYSASAGTVKLEPQFIETWVTRDGERKSETLERPEYAYIENVPICYPHFLSWAISVGSFGLVICTKYSLDLWRQQLQRIDPGDLRRFTMSGATFHPVVIGRSPSVSQDFVALKADVEDIKTYLDEIKTRFNSHTHTGVTTGPGSTGAVSATVTATYTVQCSSKVKAEV